MRAHTRPAQSAGLMDVSLASLFSGLRRWYLKRRENHYLMCADVELERMREAQMNIAYYQKKAAMVRSARLSA
jgi:hypothetical protein